MLWEYTTAKECDVCKTTKYNFSPLDLNICPDTKILSQELRNPDESYSTRYGTKIRKHDKRE